MDKVRYLLCVWCVCAALSPRGVAQELGGPEQRAEPGREASGKKSPERKLPRWLKLGFEYRGRAEASRILDSDSDDNAYLNRLRIDVTIQPVTWLRFFVQGQDARALSLDSRRAVDDLQDTVDLRQAYVDIGNPEQGLTMRVGRQALAFGDERLIGADNYWDFFGQEFDALTIGLKTPRYSALIFTGFRVKPSPLRPDPQDNNNRISGVSVPFKLSDRGILEPYLFWKRGQDTFDLMDRPGHRDVVTPGVRVQMALPLNLDCNLEMAVQRGHVVADTISAWAGHWELGWKPLGRASGLRMEAEYNFASGDKRPDDGRQGTFDDLYPAGFNKYGMADPIAWRNIRYPAVTVEMPLSKHWMIYGGYRRFHLTTIHDGLYPGGDEYLIRNPAATSGYVGSQGLVSISYSPSPRWHMFAGYGQLFSGAFLRESGFGDVLRTAYLQTSLNF